MNAAQRGFRPPLTVRPSLASPRASFLCPCVPACDETRVTTILRLGTSDGLKWVIIQAPPRQGSARTKVLLSPFCPQVSGHCVSTGQVFSFMVHVCVTAHSTQARGTVAGPLPHPVSVHPAIGACRPAPTHLQCVLPPVQGDSFLSPSPEPCKHCRRRAGSLCVCVCVCVCECVCVCVCVFVCSAKALSAPPREMFPPRETDRARRQSGSWVFSSSTNGCSAHPQFSKPLYYPISAQPLWVHYPPCPIS